MALRVVDQLKACCPSPMVSTSKKLEFHYAENAA